MSAATNPLQNVNLSSPAGTSAPTPTQQSGGMADPHGPHGRLLSMIQGLAVGVDSFAKAAATHGREGGVGEVQDYYAKQQQEKLEQEQATAQQAKAKQELQEGDLRIKAMNSQLLINEAAYHHALQMYPAEEKEASLRVLNQSSEAIKNAMAEGYDVTDPQQASLWKAMTANAINIPFSAGQSSEDVLKTVSDAASKDGKSLTDYVPLTTYTDDKHGSGGNVSLVPVAGLQQVEATPRQISTGMAEMKATLATATAALGKDDPDVKGLQGKVDTIQGILDKGGKPSAYDFISLRNSVTGPLATRIAGATQAEKIQKEKADALKAQQETDPEFQAKAAGLKAGEEARERQPYEVALKKMEAPIAAGVADNKDARDKVEANYIKPYADKMQNVSELKSAIAGAKEGNVAASRAVLLKLLGISTPGGGSKKISPEALRDMGGMGSVPQKFIGSIQEVLTGDKWTPAMQDDILAFANDQAKVAEVALRSGIRQTNALYGTQIDEDKVLGASGFSTDANLPQGGGLSRDAQAIIDKYITKNKK